VSCGIDDSGSEEGQEGFVGFGPHVIVDVTICDKWWKLDSIKRGFDIGTVGSSGEDGRGGLQMSNIDHVVIVAVNSGKAHFHFVTEIPVIE
jgi:hypothetical protein